MALPTKVKIKGTFVKTAGVLPTTDDIYETGTIRIVSDQWVKSPTLDFLVPPHEVSATLNSVGYFELSVISTDDPLWTPINRTLVVKETLSGGSRTYRIVVPYNTPGLVLDLADISPVQNPTSPLQYVLLNTVQAKGDLIVGTAANSVARLPVGTNAQVLSADPSTATGLRWVTGAGGGGIPPTLIDAKGDLIAGLANDTPDRLAVGTNGQVLKANSAATLGVEWGVLAKADVGLGNVDNTADLAKPISTAEQAALDLKANTAAPTFTGLITGVGLTLSGRLLIQTDTLTDAATIAVNASLGNSFAVTLGGNRILGTPSNAVGGMQITIAIRQDAIGGRTLAYSSAWRFSTSVPLPALSTAPNAEDLLFARYNVTDAVWDVYAFVKASGVPTLEELGIYPPKGYGFISMTGDVGTFKNSSNTGNDAAILARLYVPAGKAISVLGCAHTTAGVYSGTGGANNGMAIYTDAGVLIEAVKPGATTWTTAAPAWKFFTLATPIAAQSLPRYVYVATLVSAYTTEPNLMFNSLSAFLLKGGNGVGAHRRHFFNSGITDFPATFDPATYGNDTSGFLPLFVLG